MSEANIFIYIGKLQSHTIHGIILFTCMFSLLTYAFEKPEYITKLHVFYTKNLIFRKEESEPRDGPPLLETCFYIYIAVKIIRHLISGNFLTKTTFIYLSL